MNIIGIDIGGTKCAVCLGRYEQGTPDEVVLADRQSFLTDIPKGPEYIIGQIIGNINEVLCRNGIDTHDLSGIGISCGGPLDADKGIILSPPNLYGWDNVPITRMLEQRFGVTAKIQNDANACALAEWKFGAARGCRNVVFLTFGTGMGAGLILNGTLYDGTNNMAGEIGHLRLSTHGPVGYGKAGSFEGFCSGGGIAQLARVKVLEKLQMGEKVSFCDRLEALPELNAESVAEAARSGDPLAVEIYALCGQYLGRGLSILIDLLNPEIIVIGSIFARARDLLWPSVQQAVERESLARSRKVCQIVPAYIDEHLGDFAALAVALEE
ncbi:MAG: ROK family protein [bacterium]|nr:ROK family protein [bacterium]